MTESFSSKKLFSNATQLFVSGLFVAVISFTQNIIVAKTLGPEKFGSWSMVLAYCLLIRAFLSFRTREPLTKFLVKFKSEKSLVSLETVIATAIFVECITTLVAAIVATIGSGLLVNKFLKFQIQLDIIYLAIGSMALTPFDTVWQGMATEKKLFKLIAGFPAIFISIQCILTAILWGYGELNILSLATSKLIVSGLQFLIVVLLLGRFIRSYNIDLLRSVLPTVRMFRPEMAEFWSFMKSTYISSIVSTMVKNGDVLLLGYYRTSAEVGFYRLAKTLSSFLQSASTSLGQVAYGDLNQIIIRKDSGNLEKAIAFFKVKWPPMSMLFLTLSAVIIYILIPFVYGKEFYNTTYSFGILMVGITFSSILFWVQPISLAFGQYVENLKAVITSGLIAITLGIVLVQSFGQIGISIAMSTSWIIGYCYLLVVVGKKISKELEGI